MKQIHLFIDGSVNPKTKIGFGAYLIADFEEAASEIIQINRFENTSSSRLELENLLWCLNHIEARNLKIHIYTDSQTIIDLPKRREKLEQNQFYAKSGKRLSNHDLYQEFYQLTDQFDLELIKVKGHQPGHQKSTIDQYFSKVDRATRKALREA